MVFPAIRAAQAVNKTVALSRRVRNKADVLSFWSLRDGVAWSFSFERMRAAIEGAVIIRMAVV
ncbi:hypothetical protein [Bradyrhizobium sp. STM 3557]|uniref:hypothetical protein n=1 Tax=Bradyrhizobium sp. STM 3557 TaxID=578920 RepID=UPI00388DAAD6